MDVEGLRQVISALRSGVALTDADTWEIAFENSRFFSWFPPPEEGDDSLKARFADFRADRASERLEAGRDYHFEETGRAGSREVPVRVHLTRLEDDRVLVECTDISKERESQYMLDSYSTLAERNARDLQREKERVERLLLNIMPRAVLDELKDYGTATPQRFDDASILVLDFVGFTDMAISHDPGAIISELNDIFSAFDRIVDMSNCERLKTVGDSYIAVSGLPEPAADHAHNIARVALRMRRYLEKRNAAHTQAWTARIGIATGPVIGSLVGVQKYVYDLFGPGVNLAARMEALSEPMRITTSQETYELLRDDFVLSPRGETDIKGFGVRPLYFLESEVRGRRP